MESKYMIYWCHFVVSYENWTEKQFIIYSPDTQRATPALKSDNRTLRSFYSVQLFKPPQTHHLPMSCAVVAVVVETVRKRRKFAAKKKLL